MTTKQVHNFGNNVRFTPAMYAEPADEAGLLKLLEDHNDLSIRVIASGHAWSDAIKTDGLLINVKHFNEVRISPQGDSVYVGAGCQIKCLAAALAEQGKSLPTSGLIDEQTVAGATATGTHGSGKNSLSQYVRSVRVVHFDKETGTPKVSTITGPSVELSAARCSLGLLGVIVEVEMEIRPAYNILEYSARYQTLDQVVALEHEYPLQQFYLMPWSWHWFGQHRKETTQARSKLAGLYRVYWHVGIDWGLHLIIFALVKLMRVKSLIRFFFKRVLPLVVAKNWRVVDSSQKMLTMEHEIFRHIEIEFFVRRSDLKNALEEVKQTIQVFGGEAVSSDLQQQIPKSDHGTYQHHYPICIRRVLADETLVSMTSPFHEKDIQDWYAISLICFEWPSCRHGFFGFANFLASHMATRFHARSHWGKYNPLDRQANQQLYPRLDEFRSVVQKFDPESRFANEWLSNVILSDADRVA